MRLMWLAERPHDLKLTVTNHQPDNAGSGGYRPSSCCAPALAAEDRLTRWAAVGGGDGAVEFVTQVAPDVAGAGYDAGEKHC